MRIRVKLDVTKPLKRIMKLGFDTGIVRVFFKYEQFPTFCFHCGSIGHGSRDCMDEDSLSITAKLAKPQYGMWLKVGNNGGGGGDNRGRELVNTEEEVAYSNKMPDNQEAINELDTGNYMEKTCMSQGMMEIHLPIQGDFNEVLHESDCVGQGIRPQSQMGNFHEALENCELIDMGFSGNKFTWIRGNRTDHIPILFKIKENLNSTTSKWNKLFHFEVMWMRSKDCERIIRDSWGAIDSLEILGDLTSRLENCRIGLVQWSKREFGYVRRQTDKIRKQMEAILLQGINDTNQQLFGELQAQPEDFLEKEDLTWRQRSKLHWYKEGDHNTRYFHSVATKRLRHNMVIKLWDQSGQWCDKLKEIEGIIIDYFNNLFSTSAPLIEDMNRVMERIPRKVDNEDLYHVVFGRNVAKQGVNETRLGTYRTVRIAWMEIWCNRNSQIFEGKGKLPEMISTSATQHRLAFKEANLQ
ncbi:hypothetical protein ACH5RR_006872 [Cinchona calisaya]|uniref:CCHC-type domain-containing protein n=1 Tax=Cinchona calisaya TaxID=153742 RepID=A0ABD3AQA2_9GENT